MSRRGKQAQMSFLEHLEELRWVLFRCLGALLASTVVGLTYTELVYRALLYPVRDYLSPTLREQHFAAPTPLRGLAVVPVGEVAPLAMPSPPTELEKRFQQQEAAIVALEARLAKFEAVLATGRDGPQLQIIYTSPAEPFMIRLRVAFIGGIALGLPLVAYFVWSFVAPGLRGRERQQLKRGLRIGTLLFVAGGLFGYAFLPFGIPVLMRFGTPGVAQYWPLGTYIAFCTRLILAFAIVFELPVLLDLLARLGLVDAENLRRGRPYALVAILVTAALLTPPDVFSQTILALPMLALYEIGIMVVARQDRQREHEPTDLIDLEN